MTTDKESSNPQSSPRLPVTPQTIWTIFAGIVFMFGTFYGLVSYVKSIVRDQVEDPRVLQKLFRVIRPSVVFDEKERVLGDFGAMSLLEGVAVTPSQADQPLRIVVKPREFLGVEPILTSLDSPAVIRGERGRGFTWVFRVYWIQSILAEKPPEPSPQRFRLELLR
jgi:hypothetical protein